MLNKKALRKFVDGSPAPPIPPDHGLLHAQQIDYIVRADVKIIDRHRTLVLYIYDRKQAAGGDTAPVWTMFQACGAYITLARRPDGTTFWRTAAFERLANCWGFASKCAFYSSRDQNRVSRYFHDDSPDFAPLVNAQDKILNRRRQERERRRDNAVRARMKGLPALPRDLAHWAHRNVMPAYFIYNHARGGKAAGICSSCGQEAALSGVKHNAKGICPHCGRTLTMKPRGRIARLYDRDTCQVIQQTKTGEIVVRIIKACCSYWDEKPKTVVYESARQFIRLDRDGIVKCDSYYYSYAGSKWKHGSRPVPFPYQYHFELDMCGHVYCGNLSRSLRGTPWQYCPVRIFYEHFRGPMEMIPFLTAHIKHPRLEHLIKTGFYNLASDLVYRGGYGLELDEAQKRTHRILRVGAEDVDYLRNMDIDLSSLKTFQDYCRRNLKDRQRLLTWQLDKKVGRDIEPALEHMTAHKFIRYMELQYSALQYRLTKYKTPRYPSMQDLVTEYRDYLNMCRKLGYDTLNSFVLYPKDLQKAHDNAAHRVKVKADAQLRRDFTAAMKAITRHLDFEMNGMKILIPSNPDEIIAEGQALHHCVGTYVERVAKHECIILFLRQSGSPDKPFFTVEIRNRKAVQVRGMRNCPATPDVQAFVDHYEKQILSAA